MKLNKGSLWGMRFLISAILTLMPCISAQAVSNLHFHGALVSEPCVLAPQDENILLDFGTVLDKYLYINTRTRGKIFVLHLLECDSNIGNSMKITFMGTESNALPGLVALDSASQAAGIAIGIETPDGKPLPLNHPSNAYTLLDGSNMIALHAYVQGEPDALSNKTITRGPFSVMVTFGLEYE